MAHNRDGPKTEFSGIGGRTPDYPDLEEPIVAAGGLLSFGPIEPY
jgi:hypothetical protein